MQLESVQLANITRKQLINIIVSPAVINGEQRIVSDFKTLDDVLWAIVETTNSVTYQKRKQIICFELRFNSDFQGWGYTAYPEENGPEHYSCPISFINKVPDPHLGLSSVWRQKVTEYHVKKA